MNKTILAICLFTSVFTVSCSTARYAESKTARNLYQQLSPADRQLADTLIKKVLDNEGLYTVIGKLKPMSSVTELYVKVAAKDTTFRGARSVTDTLSADLQKLKRYQHIVNALQFGDLRFMMSPYKASQKEQRVMQISVHRKSLIDSLLRVNASFFGQFGFVPGMRPEILVNTTEYEQQYNRYRAYGYLFGYPEHAVTFFTEASISESRNGVFVKRDFYQIPVFSGKQGHFVYAVPQGYIATTIDSALYHRAVAALALYEKERARFMNADGSVQYYALLQKLLRLNGRP